MDVFSTWILTPSDWVVLSLFAAAILSFPAETLWKRRRRSAGVPDLITAKQAAEHVAEAALDPAESLTEDTLTQAFLEICRQAEHGNLVLKGRYNSRFAPILDIEADMVKFSIPDANTYALNIPAPAGEGVARRQDGTPYGYKRLYVSKAEVSELWPSQSS